MWPTIATLVLIVLLCGADGFRPVPVSKVQTWQRPLLTPVHLYKQSESNYSLRDYSELGFMAGVAKPLDDTSDWYALNYVDLSGYSEKYFKGAIDVFVGFGRPTCTTYRCQSRSCWRLRLESLA